VDDLEHDPYGTTTVLSASSVTTFLRCGQQWFFAYVAGVKSPPTLKAVRGIAAHRAVEVDMSQKLITGEDIPEDDMVDAYSTSFDHEIVNGYRTDAGVTVGDIKDKGVELVKLYRSDVAPTIQPMAVEMPIRFKINNQEWSGQIDLVESMSHAGDSRPRVRDTKTTARTPSSDSYLLAMTGYAIGARKALGEVESDVILDYLIALKTPIYKEIRFGGPVTDDQINRFARVVGDVAGAIRAGRFVPNGLVSGACSWCGYQAICPAYQGKDPL
jgi:hypothetical protein